MAFSPKNMFHISNTTLKGNYQDIELKFLDIEKIAFGSIASYFYYFPLSVSYRYGNLYRLIPIMIPIRHFSYQQYQSANQYWIIRLFYNQIIQRTIRHLISDLHIYYPSDIPSFKIIEKFCFWWHFLHFFQSNHLELEQVLSQFKTF